MKIAYLISEDLSKHPGLSLKILAQIKYWESQKHKVYRVFLTSRMVIDPDGNEFLIDNSINTSNLSSKKLYIFKSLSLQYKFAFKALKLIRPDITYSRYLFPAPNINKIRKVSGKLIFEINSDDRSEYLQKNIITGIYNALFRYFSLSPVDGMVFVTQELSKLKSFSSFNKNSSIIANGIDTSEVDFFSELSNDKPQLVFIGTPEQSWHGLDKILLLSEKLENCVFHIVGPSKESCKELWGGLPNNVVFHGYLSGSDSSDLIKMMDIGIGTLAQYRTGMHETCALKVRQYLANGLPVIAASKDTDIPEGKSFYLKLPNEEGNIANNIDVILEFVNYAFNNSELRLEARYFAEKNLSVSKKEVIRLSFFDKVISL